MSSVEHSLEPRFQDGLSDRSGNVTAVRRGVRLIAFDDDGERDLGVVRGREADGHALARSPSPVSAVPVLAATETLGRAIGVPEPYG